MPEKEVPLRVNFDLALPDITNAMEKVLEEHGWEKRKVKTRLGPEVELWAKGEQVLTPVEARRLAIDMIRELQKSMEDFRITEQVGGPPQ